MVSRGGASARLPPHDPANEEDEDDYHPRHRAPTLDDSDSQAARGGGRVSMNNNTPHDVRADERTPLLPSSTSTAAAAAAAARQYSGNATTSSSSTFNDPSSKRQRRSKLSRSWKYTLGFSSALIGGGLLIIVTVTVILLVSSNSSSILLHFLSSLGSLSTCSTCFSLLVPLRQLAILGDRAFTNTFTTLCVDLRIQPAEVCQGAVARQGPVIAQSLRAIQPNRRTAASLCTKLFGLCGNRGGPIQDWPSEVFPKPDETHRSKKKKKKKTRSGKIRRVVQISDLHVDRLYKAGAEASCVGVMCCRAESGLLPDRSKSMRKAGPYGDIRCDTPPSLFKSMLDAIQKHAGDAEFVISTGDVPSHAVWEETPELTSRDIYEAYAIMRASLSMPVYGSIGNHDIAPVNLFPPSSNYQAFAASQWVYDTHYNAWRDWIGDSVNQTTFSKHVGSYAVTVQSMDLRLISINTNYWSPDDFYLYATEFQPDDPEGILGFLMQELQKAETSGQRAIIIGHASPSMAMPEQSHFFDQIIQRYRATVVAQFYGHTHSSDFVLGYATPASKSPETASSVSFIAGALTPLGGMVNPGFRVYDLDEATGEVWDWKEYYTNISDPTFNDGPVWQQLYTARQAYGPLVPGSEGEPLGPAFWHRLTQVLESSEQAFRTFIFNKFRGSRFGQRKACRTDKCRAYAICGLRRGRSEERCSAIRLSNELDSTPPSAPRPTTHIPSSSDPGDDGGDGRTDTDDDAQTDHGISTELSAEDMEALDANEMSRQGGGHTNIHNFGLKELLLGIHDRTASDAAEVQRLKTKHSRKAKLRGMLMDRAST